MKKHKGRAKVGDVLEVQTPKGLAYAQYSHRSPLFGALIRVLPGFYVSRPASFANLVQSEERFYVFFPVGTAVSQNLVDIVASERVPEEKQKFPLMRMAGLPDEDGRVLDWGLYDGERNWSVDSLTPEQQTLSIVEAWGYPVLVQRIAEDWSPVGAYSSGVKTAVNNGHVKSGVTDRARVKHYLYFPTQAVAIEASRILKSEGGDAQVEQGTDDANWLVLVSSSFNPNTKDHTNTISRLENLASSLGGEYDGDEIAL